VVGVTPEDEARVATLEREMEELRRELEQWRSRGLELLRFKSLDDLYAARGHTH
jgi:hypothetical protein